MDEAARAEAWDSYRSMSESYTLEVRPAGGRGEVFPGLVVTPAAGRGPSCPPGSGAPRGSPSAPPPTGPGVGTLAARLRSGNRAFKKLSAAPKANPVLLLFPLGFGMGNTCCPNAAPARPRSRWGPGYKLTATWSAEGTGAGAGPARRRGGACPWGAPRVARGWGFCSPPSAPFPRNLIASAQLFDSAREVWGRALTYVGNGAGGGRFPPPSMG